MRRATLLAAAAMLLAGAAAAATLTTPHPPADRPCVISAIAAMLGRARADDAAAVARDALDEAEFAAVLDPWGQGGGQGGGQGVGATAPETLAGADP